MLQNRNWNHQKNLSLEEAVRASTLLRVIFDELRCQCVKEKPNKQNLTLDSQDKGENDVPVKGMTLF